MRCSGIKACRRAGCLVSYQSFAGEPDIQSNARTIPRSTHGDEYVFHFIRLYTFAEYHRLAVLAVEERYVAVRQLISQISAAAKNLFPGQQAAAHCGIEMWVRYQNRVISV